MVKQADMASGAKTAREKRDEVVVTIDAVCRPHVARPKLLALRWLDASVLVLVAVVVVFVLDAGTDVFAWLGRVLDVAAGRSASAVYAVGAAASVVAGAVLVLPLVRGDRRKAVAELTLPAAVRVAASVLLARPTVLAAIGAGLLTGFAGKSAGVAGLRAGLAGEHVVCDLGRAGVWPWAATAGAASMPASLAAVLVLMGMGSGGLLLAVGLHGSWRVCVRDAKRRVAKRERERRAAEHAKDVLAERGDSPFVDFEDLRAWFESDDPITHPDEDRFDHRFVAHAVARKIDGFSTDRFKPASMQVLGPRGSGKSSLMAMVEYYLNHPHAKPMREAAGSGVVATEGTEGTEAGENSVARSEPDRSPARPATYIVTSVSLWEFTSAEAAMRAILRALVDAIGERAPTADLLGVPSRYAAVVAAPGGLWALAGAVLAGAIEPEDLIARIGRRAVAAGVNVLLWIDDLERFETSETDTLTKLGALLTLMRRTEGLSFVIACSPSAAPATNADGAAVAGFDFEKVVDGTEWVRVEHAPMNAVLMQFRAECERVRRVVEGVPLRDLSAQRLLDQVLVGHVEFERVPSMMTHALLDVIETPRELKHVFKRVWHAWDPVDVKHPRDGALCGEIDLDDFIVFTTLRCRSLPAKDVHSGTAAMVFWGELLSDELAGHYVRKSVTGQANSKANSATPTTKRVAKSIEESIRDAAREAAEHPDIADSAVRLLWWRKHDGVKSRVYQAVFGPVGAYMDRAIVERAESTPSDREWKAQCRFVTKNAWNPSGTAEAHAVWTMMNAADDGDYARFVDVAALCGEQAISSLLEAAKADFVTRAHDNNPQRAEWAALMRRVDVLVREKTKGDTARRAELLAIVNGVMSAAGLSVASAMLIAEEFRVTSGSLGASLTRQEHEELAAAFVASFEGPEGNDRLIAHLKYLPHGALDQLFRLQSAAAQPEPGGDHPWSKAACVVLTAAESDPAVVVPHLLRVATPAQLLDVSRVCELFGTGVMRAFELIAQLDPSTKVNGLSQTDVERLVNKAKEAADGHQEASWEA